MNRAPSIGPNLFEVGPGDGETSEGLAEGASFRFERILSRGAASPPGLWYDQERSEWVALLAGRATLELEDGERLALVAGDAIVIPAHLRHRVESASGDAVWLALHFESRGGETSS